MHGRGVVCRKLLVDVVEIYRGRFGKVEAALDAGVVPDGVDFWVFARNPGSYLVSITVAHRRRTFFSLSTVVAYHSTTINNNNKRKIERRKNKKATHFSINSGNFSSCVISNT